MGKYKICVYAICKNESKFVDRWVDSMSEADKIVVFDTGSTDDTVEKFKARGIEIKQEFMDPFRFDTARNIALSMVPDEYDICICTDLDEYFTKGWREKVEKYWTPDATRARYKFVSGFLPNGNEDICFLNEKIHIKDGFVWKHPIHECLVYKGDKPDKYVKIDNMQLEHHPDNSKSRAQYLDMLEKVIEENPNDDRNLHLLGREYFAYKKWDKCIETCLKHVNSKTSTWNNQRCSSMRYISASYLKLEEKEKAMYWNIRACREAPHLREPFLDAAKFFFYVEFDNELTEYYLDKALAIETRGVDYYFAEPQAWGSFIYHLTAIVKYRLKKYSESFSNILRAREIDPTDQAIQSAYNSIKSVVENYYR